MDIASNLKKYRSKSNISQQEVADTLGIDRKTYIGWESGISNVKSQYIPELAKLFNIEIGELFREKSSDIIINQHNTDNKENSINGVILLLTDKEMMNQLVNLVKKRVVKKQKKKKEKKKPRL
jgi:transcriptional regulator with XRE-family HTH domain